MRFITVGNPGLEPSSANLSQFDPSTIALLSSEHKRRLSPTEHQLLSQEPEDTCLVWDCTVAANDTSLLLQPHYPHSTHILVKQLHKFPASVFFMHINNNKEITHYCVPHSSLSRQLIPSEGLTIQQIQNICPLFQKNSAENVLQQSLQVDSRWPNATVAFAGFLPGSNNTVVRLLLQSSSQQYLVQWHWQSNQLDVLELPEGATFVSSQQRENTTRNDLILSSTSAAGGRCFIPVYNNANDPDFMAALYLHSGPMDTDAISRMNQLNHFTVSVESLKASLDGQQLNTVGFFFKNWEERVANCLQQEAELIKVGSNTAGGMVVPTVGDNLISSIALILSYIRQYMLGNHTSGGGAVSSADYDRGDNPNQIEMKQRFAQQLLQLLNHFLVNVIGKVRDLGGLQHSSSSSEADSLFNRLLQYVRDLRKMFPDPLQPLSEGFYNAAGKRRSDLTSANTRQRIRLRRSRTLTDVLHPPSEEEFLTESVPSATMMTPTTTGSLSGAAITTTPSGSSHASLKAPAYWETLELAEIVRECLLRGRRALASFYCEHRFGRTLEESLITRDLHNCVIEFIENDDWCNTFTVLINTGHNPQHYLIHLAFETELKLLRDKILFKLSTDEYLHDTNSPLPPWSVEDLQRLRKVETLFEKHHHNKQFHVRLRWICNLTEQQCNHLEKQCIIADPEATAQLSAAARVDLYCHLLERGQWPVAVQLSAQDNSSLLDCVAQHFVLSTTPQKTVAARTFAYPHEIVAFPRWPTFSVWQFWCELTQQVNSFVDFLRKLGVQSPLLLLRYLLTFAALENTPTSLPQMLQSLPKSLVQDLWMVCVSLVNASPQQSALMTMSLVHMFQHNLKEILSSTNQISPLLRLAAVFHLMSQTTQPQADDTLDLGASVANFIHPQDGEAVAALDDNVLIPYFLLGESSLDLATPLEEDGGRHKATIFYRISHLIQFSPNTESGLDARVTVYDLLQWASYPLDLKSTFTWQQDNRLAVNARGPQSQKHEILTFEHPHSLQLPVTLHPMQFKDRLTFPYYLRQGMPLDACVVLVTDLEECGHTWSRDTHSELTVEVTHWIHKFAMKYMEEPRTLASCFMLMKLLDLDQRPLACHLQVVDCLLDWLLHTTTDSHLSKFISSSEEVDKRTEILSNLRRTIMKCHYSSEQHSSVLAASIIEQMEKSILWKMESNKVHNLEELMNLLYVIVDVADLYGVDRLPSGVLHYYARHNDWLTFLCLAEAFAFGPDQVKDALQEFPSSSSRDHLSYVVTKVEPGATFEVPHKLTSAMKKRSEVNTPNPDANQLTAIQNQQSIAKRTVQVSKLTQTFRYPRASEKKDPVFSRQTNGVVPTLPASTTTNDSSRTSSSRKLTISCSEVEPTLYLSRLKQFAPNDLSSLLFDCMETPVRRSILGEQKSRQKVSFSWTRLSAYAIALRHPLLSVMASCVESKMSPSTSNTSTAAEYSSGGNNFSRTITHIATFIVASLPEQLYETVIGSWNDCIKLDWTQSDLADLMFFLIKNGICAPVEDAFFIFLPSIPLVPLLGIVRHCVEDWNSCLRWECAEKFAEDCKTWAVNPLAFSDLSADNLTQWIRSLAHQLCLHTLLYLLAERGADLALLFLRDWLTLVDQSTATRRQLMQVERSLSAGSGGGGAGSSSSPSGTTTVHLTMVKNVLSILVKSVHNTAKPMIKAHCLGLCYDASQCLHDPSSALISLLNDFEAGDHFNYHDSIYSKEEFLKLLKGKLKKILPSMGAWELPSNDSSRLSKNEIYNFLAKCLGPNHMTKKSKTSASIVLSNQWRESVSIPVELDQTVLCNPFDPAECQRHTVHIASAREAKQIESLLDEGRFVDAHRFAVQHSITHAELFIMKLILLLSCSYKFPHQVPESIQSQFQNKKRLALPTMTSQSSSDRPPIKSTSEAHLGRFVLNNATGMDLGPFSTSDSHCLNVLLTVDALCSLLRHGSDYADNCLRLLYVSWRLEKSYASLLQSSEIEVVSKILTDDSANLSVEERLHTLHCYLMAVDISENDLLQYGLDAALVVLTDECQVDQKSTFYPPNLCGYVKSKDGSSRRSSLVDGGVAITGNSSNRGGGGAATTAAARMRAAGTPTRPDLDILRSTNSSLYSSPSVPVMNAKIMKRKSMAGPTDLGVSGAGSLASKTRAWRLGKLCYNRSAQRSSLLQRRSFQTDNLLTTSSGNTSNASSLTSRCFELTSLIKTLCGLNVLSKLASASPLLFKEWMPLRLKSSTGISRNSRDRAVRFLSRMGDCFLQESQRLWTLLVTATTPSTQSFSSSAHSNDRFTTTVHSGGANIPPSELSHLTSNELEYIVEVVILANKCFGDADNSEGVSHCLKIAQQIAPTLDRKECYGPLVRLLMGMEHFSEMTYIFDQLIKANQFELLLGKTENKENGIVITLLEYLQRYQSRDIELLKLVCIKHNLNYELATVQQKQAHKLKHLIKSSMRRPNCDEPSLRNMCTQASKHLLDAAALYERDNHFLLARTCFHEAQVYAAQIVWLQNPKSFVANENAIASASAAASPLTNTLQESLGGEAFVGTTTGGGGGGGGPIPGLLGTGLPQGVEVIDLRQNDAILWLRHNSSFYEAFIWVQCDRVKAVNLWPVLLLDHVLVRGDLKYFNKYLFYHGRAVSADIIQECVARFKNLKKKNPRHVQNLKEMLKHCNNAVLVNSLKTDFSISD